MAFRNALFLAPLLFIQTIGCNRSNEVNSHMMPAITNEPVLSENQEVFFVLKDASITPSSKSTPSSFYVRGTIQNGVFAPAGGVLGEGNLNSTGEPGWMELVARKFYPMHTAQAPLSPYVEGHMTQNGFVPSSREIR